jgi:hypothetical protein
MVGDTRRGSAHSFERTGREVRSNYVKIGPSYEATTGGDPKMAVHHDHCPRVVNF